ncbi:hypothetical protein [Thalassovita sp.]|uniref:hypothetical protein n=1 Tax=Thalassovita sp. TaxID=1979401 RepID=UPI0028819953|nr:hypothetical protein [Thalassovita sp.]MDF1803212.1 hypothetical protein [Thalassovita sp.]
MSQLSPYRIASLSEFRRNTAQHAGWVQHAGGRLWLTRHGRTVAALVPMHQCQMLETWESRSLEEERRRYERSYSRWKAIKAQEPGSDEPFIWETS